MGNSKYSSKEYTRSYKDFKGVDMCGKGGEVACNRLSACINMYKDYSAEGAPVIESVPGYRRLAQLPGAINALYRQSSPKGDVLIIHSGRELYRFSPTDTSPQLLTALKGDKSSGFCHGGSFYLLCEGELFRIDGDGGIYGFGEEGNRPYVPTTFRDGIAYEQRNLLTDSFTEVFNVGDYELYAHGTPGLRYEITDSDLGLCAVCDIDEGVEGTVFIPGRIRIGNTLYKVDSIADNAFAYNSKITEVYIGEGVRSMGKFAFRYCVNMKRAVTPRSLGFIDNAAFMDCARMSEIYIGTGLEGLGESVFSACISLTDVKYGGDAESFAKIANVGLLSIYSVSYGVLDHTCRADLHLSSPVAAVTEVTVNGTPHSFYLTFNEEGGATVTLPLSAPSEITGAHVEIHGLLASLGKEEGGYTDFLSTPEGAAVGGISGVLGCSLTECFDGRVFYSGNPSLPNTVFYSARRRDGVADPLYVGGYCYFNDGIGSYPVISMLSVRDSLTVFKAGDDGTGSIFYHTVKTTGDNVVPKVYPVSYVHSGLCAKGPSLNFLDDPVFISSMGLSAIKQSAINYERSIATRSHNVNYELLREDPGRITLTEWAGYLAVGCGSRVYLADSRSTFAHPTGDTEYEWFFLCGIGEWKNSKTVYRYASDPREGLFVHPEPDTVCYEEVYSKLTDEGLVYYAIIDGLSYALYATEERIGGDFYPATVYLGIGDLLYFGTEGGSLMLFNTDKRGVPPQRLTEKEDFDPVDYEERMGRQIHPDFYSFDGHAVQYAITTPLDDCGIPNMTKATVKRSTVLKCKAFTQGSLTVDVSTDLRGYSQLTEFSPGELNFTELDFSRLSLTNGEFISVPINEREKGWVEKQFTLYSSSYCCPLGICSLTYRYTLHGNVKRR